MITMENISFSDVDNISSQVLEETTTSTQELLGQIRFYSLGFIISFGIISNVIVLRVFLRTSLRKSTTGHFLTSLAFADTTLLIGELLLWMSPPFPTVLGLNFSNESDFWCKLMYFLRYTGRIWSSWLTVTIATERYITIGFPLRVGEISTPNKAKQIIIVEIIMSLGMASFSLFTIGLEDAATLDPRVNKTNITLCLILKENKNVYNIFNWVVIRFVILILPSVIVCIFTVLILKHLAHARRSRSHLQHRKIRLYQDGRLTALLLAVAISFVVIRLPYGIIYYIDTNKQHIWGTNVDPHILERLLSAKRFTHILSVCNYAINFILYCFCGSVFRQKLKESFTRKRSTSISSFRMSTSQHSWRISMKMKQSARRGSLTTNGSPLSHSEKDSERQCMLEMVTRKKTLWS